MIFLRILIGAVLILVIPFAVSYVVRRVKKLFVTLFVFLARIIRRVVERHHIAGKLNRLSIQVAKFFSVPRIVIGQIALTLLSAWVLAKYISEIDVFNVLWRLTLLGLMPLAWLAIALCGSQRVLRALECPFCVVIRWTLLLILLWIAHAHTAEDLSLLFGPAASRLPVASGLGAFLRAIGYLALPTAFLMASSQILMFIAFGTVAGGKLQILGRSRFIAPVVTAVLLLTVTVWNSAQVVLVSAPLERLLVAHVAFENDMLSEEVCNGKKSNRRVVYFEADQSRAFVFSSPKAGERARPKVESLRKLKADEIKAMIPTYEGVIACHWPVTPPESSDVQKS
ncbi:hypothetical protein PCO31110_04738 [Pandoraea communis]|uniref:Uncharacterized protein n=1 Tax=Pandoraea communis TaxID=2508297 RepID=A0A5E4YPZ1_9BURK|nr:hypothetical protein [Pandoraea communis]VVE50861.1 hypothetical protein PCO31110_04738 [Pandoraea communis]